MHGQLIPSRTRRQSEAVRYLLFCLGRLASSAEGLTARGIAESSTLADPTSYKPDRVLRNLSRLPEFVSAKSVQGETVFELTARGAKLYAYLCSLN
jgi:hypothetical protein